MKTARDLAKASYVASVVGIVVAVIIIFVVLVAVSRFCFGNTYFEHDNFQYAYT